MTKSKDLLPDELIGLELKVISSSNPSLVGIQGKVVDESLNMLVIQVGAGLKHVPKSKSIFELASDPKLRIPGDLLNFRPEDRIKKSPRRLSLGKGFRIKELMARLGLE